MNMPQTFHLPVPIDLELQIGLFYRLAILEKANVNHIIVDKADFLLIGPAWRFPEKRRLISNPASEFLGFPGVILPTDAWTEHLPSHRTTAACPWECLQVSFFHSGTEADPKLVCPWSAFCPVCM